MSAQWALLPSMLLSKITDFKEYLEWPLTFDFQPIVGLNFPPGMLAIFAALQCAKDWLNNNQWDLRTTSIDLLGYKEEIETWDIDIKLEEFDIGLSWTLEIKVIRERNDYNAQILRQVDNIFNN